ncbi:MAG: DUF4360 domain-containing protein [Myxococcota bacterium]
MKISFVAAWSLVALSLLAQDVKLGTPVFSGPGCHLDMVSYAHSPNANSLSMLFSGYTIAANPYRGSNRTSCEISIPLTIANSTLLAVDYRGFHDLPDFAISGRTMTYSFSDGQQSTRWNTFKGGDIGTDIYTDQLDTFCIGFRILKIALEHTLFSNSTDRDAQVSLDSIDIGATLSPGPKVQVCNSARQIPLVIAGILAGIASLVAF